MKFSCTTKDIATAVGAASKVVNAHTTVPVLSNVLLQADGGKIAVRATDLELTLEHAFPAQVAEGGSVTVPAKLFASYLGNLSPGTLELTGTPTRASVKYQRSNYDFHALPAEEYPPLPAAARGAEFSIAAKRFRDGIDATIFAASSEEARGAVLMGTLLEVEGNALTMVATDGYRLAKFVTTLERRRDGSREIYRTFARIGRSRAQPRRRRTDCNQRARRTEQPASDDERRRHHNRAPRRRTISELPAGYSGKVRPHDHREHAAAHRKPSSRGTRCG